MGPKTQKRQNSKALHLSENWCIKDQKVYLSIVAGMVMFRGRRFLDLIFILGVLRCLYPCCGRRPQRRASRNRGGSYWTTTRLRVIAGGLSPRDCGVSRKWDRHEGPSVGEVQRH